MAYHKGSPPWQLIDGLNLVLNGNSAPFTREGLRDWRKRESEGKGKSDEMKEIKMEMNCAVEILTTQVFPSQVALIASLRDTFLCCIDCSLCTTADVTCLRNLIWLFFFPPLVTGEMYVFFFWGGGYESEALYWFTLHGELPVAL